MGLGLEHSPDTPCTHRCFMDMFYGHVLWRYQGFLPHTQRKAVLTWYLLPVNHSRTREHMLQLALGSVCALQMEMMLAR